MADKLTGRAVSSVIKECKTTLTARLSEWLKKNSDNAECWLGHRKPGHIHTAGGCREAQLCGRWFSGLTITEHIPAKPALLGIYAPEMKTYIHIKTCTEMFKTGF
jgi:hypothetical protein